MRINQNVMALLSHAAYSRNAGLLGKSMERLATGLRINSGGDDAAGLGMSERLRVQLRGLERATLNAQDGLSMMQTADDALGGVNSALQRMRELAVQALNGTLTAGDRLAIQNEVSSLQKEINQIASGTQFNTRSLLNGDQGVRVTSSSQTATAYYSGTAIPTPGTYRVTVSEVTGGTAQVQKSTAFSVDGTGAAAGSGTKLQSIAQFYKDGQFLLASPQTITLTGNGRTADVQLSGNMTLGELATAMKSAAVDTLGMGSASATVQTSGMASPGAITLTSGMPGQVGELTVIGPTDTVLALGFNQVTAAVDPVTRVTVTREGATSASGQVTGNVAGGLIQGLNLRFDTVTAAAMLGSTAEAGIRNTAFMSFNIVDNLRNSATVSLAAGSYSLDQAASIMNVSLAATNVRASVYVDGNNLAFRTVDTGSGAYVSITGVTAGNALGIANGRYSGAGGTTPMVAGFADVNNVNFSGAGSSGSLVIIDSHSIQVNISLTLNYTTLDNLVTSINSRLITGNSAVRAQASGNTLQLVSTETGAAAGLNVAVGGTTGGKLSLTPGGATGSGGNIGNVTFTSDSTRRIVGFELYDAAAAPIQFQITDNLGNSATVNLPTGNTDGAAFRPGASIVDVINAALTNVRAAANFTDDQRIRIALTTAGAGNTLAFSDLSTGTARAYDNLGLATGSATGTGAGEFRITVTNAASQYQIGTRAGDQLNFAFPDVRTAALGIDSLNLTSAAGASRALTQIDQAIDRVSSYRGQVGAAENQLTRSVDLLRDASSNVAAAESRIRDLDFALELINFARYSILNDSSTAMIAQSNLMPGNVQTLLDMLKR